MKHNITNGTLMETRITAIFSDYDGTLFHRFCEKSPKQDTWTIRTDIVGYFSKDTCVYYIISCPRTNLANNVWGNNDILIERKFTSNKEISAGITFDYRHLDNWRLHKIIIFNMSGAKRLTSLLLEYQTMFKNRPQPRLPSVILIVKTKYGISTVTCATHGCHF